MRNKKLISTLFILLLLCILGYAGYTARHILLGPQLYLDMPNNTIEVTTQVIAITGKAQNTLELTLNNKQVLITDAGIFNERMLLSAGANNFIFDAQDKFGRRTQKTFTVIYVPRDNDVLQLKDDTNNRVNDFEPTP